MIDLWSGAGNDAFIARSETEKPSKVIGIDLSANRADVIVSNCVLNLVPNKDGVSKEIKRVLKAEATLVFQISF